MRVSTPWAAVGLGVSGYMVAFIVSLLDWKGVAVPDWLFILLLVPSSLMFLIGLSLFVWPYAKVLSRLRLTIKPLNDRGPLSMSRLGQILSSMIADDENNFRNVIRLVDTRIDFDNANKEIGAFLLIGCEVWNASVLDVEFSSEPSGHLYYENLINDGGDIIQSPEIEWQATTRRFGRHGRGSLVLKQLIPKDIVDDLMSLEGREVMFSFGNIRLDVQTYHPAGDRGSVLRFPFPPRLVVLVPRIAYGATPQQVPGMEAPRTPSSA